MLEEVLFQDKNLAETDVKYLFNYKLSSLEYIKILFIILWMNF